MDASAPRREGRPVLAALACLAGLLLTSVRAGSAPATGPLRVTKTAGATDCPDAAELEARVASFSGGQGTRPGTSRVTDGAAVEVEFSRGGDGYLATIRTPGPPPGARTVTDAGATCAGLSAAVAVALVLLLDQGDPRDVEEGPAPSPDAGTPPPSPNPDGGASPAASPSAAPPGPMPPPPAPPPPASAAPASTHPPPRSATRSRDQAAPSVESHPAHRIRLATEIGFSAAGGVLGTFDPGLFADVQLIPSRGFSVSLGARWLADRHFELAPGSVDVSLLSAWVEACAMPFTRHRGIGFCVTPALGRLHGSAEGYTRDSEASRPWFAVAVGAAYRGAILGPFGGVLRAEVVIPAPRQGFSIQGVGVPYTPATIAFMLEVGASASIW